MATAIATHLESLVANERSWALRAVSRLRLVLASVVVGVAIHGVAMGLPDVIAAAPWVVLYAALALSLLVVGRYHTWPLAWAPLAEIPIATIATIESARFINPLYTLNTLPVYPLFVLFSALSLDRLVIGVTTLAAMVWCFVLVFATGCPPDEAVVSLPCVAGAGLASAFLVTRIRSLVVESRRKDFAGKYVLGRRLGVGGMAEVFEATYSPEGGFERKVAVKRILEAHAEDPRFIEMFRREASVGAQLAHPNLVQVLDFGRHETSWFIAMEFVDGVPLSALMRRWLRGESTPSLELKALVIHSLAEGLAYLHSKRAPNGLVGLIHRDLNPPNVLVTRGGDVKISDFGIAQWSSAGVTQAGVVRGKLGYLAPELKRGAPSSVASDVYSLGVVFFELLTNTRHDGEQAGSRVVVPLSILQPDLPSDLASLVEQMLRETPGERPTAADVLRAAQTVQAKVGSTVIAREELMNEITALDGEPSVAEGQSKTRTVSVLVRPADSAGVVS